MTPGCINLIAEDRSAQEVILFVQLVGWFAVLGLLEIKSRVTGKENTIPMYEFLHWAGECARKREHTEPGGALGFYFNPGGS